MRQVGAAFQHPDILLLGQPQRGEPFFPLVGTRSLSGASLKSFPPGRRVWPNSFQNIQKIVKVTTLSGPPARGQLSGAFYSAQQKQPTGGYTNEEVAFVRRITVVLGLAALMAATVMLMAGASGEQDSYLPTF
jgi:hypothetical protein